MNIIVGQNESLPNIKGYLSGSTGGVGIGVNDYAIKGAFKSFRKCDYRVYWEHSPSYDAIFDASRTFDDLASPTEPDQWINKPNPAYKDGAKVTTLNFTSKLWFRKF